MPQKDQNSWLGSRVRKLVDYHCHILPEIDDGAKNISESLEMAEILQNSGFTRIYCTPHCLRGVYNTTKNDVVKAVEALQARIDEASLKLKLYTGMEYYLDEFFPQEMDNPLTLGDTNLILVESATSINAVHLKQMINMIISKGYVPVLAHPERYLYQLQPLKAGVFSPRAAIKKINKNPIDADLPGILNELHAFGCRFQGNIGSFGGLYGSETVLNALIFNYKGLYHYYGTDGHRPEQLRKALQGMKRIATSS